MLHQLDTYKDGYQNIQFCKICSAEGEKLSLECVGMTETNELEEKSKIFGRMLTRNLRDAN